MINGVFGKMNAQLHPCGVPRVQQPHSCLTRLRPLQEHSPTGIAINRNFHHDERCIMENECSTSPTTPLLPCEVAPHLQNIRQRELHFPEKTTLKKTDISTMINGVFWKMNAQWHPCGVPRVQQRHSCFSR